MAGFFVNSIKDIGHSPFLALLFYSDEHKEESQRKLIRGGKMGTCGSHCWNRETGEVEMGYDLEPAY